LLPLELDLEKNISQGGMTRGHISSTFWFDLKKKGNIVSITLCFPIGTIVQQNQKFKLDAHQKLQTTNYDSCTTKA
jgi:hypothetical protein